MVEDIFSVYFNDWKSIFTFFCEGHKFSAWLKKKKRKKEERNTPRGEE